MMYTANTSGSVFVRLHTTLGNWSIALWRLLAGMERVLLVMVLHDVLQHSVSTTWLVAVWRRSQEVLSSFPAWGNQDAYATCLRQAIGALFMHCRQHSGIVLFMIVCVLIRFANETDILCRPIRPAEPQDPAANANDYWRHVTYYLRFLTA